MEMNPGKRKHLMDDANETINKKNKYAPTTTKTLKELFAEDLPLNIPLELAKLIVDYGMSFIDLGANAVELLYDIVFPGGTVIKDCDEILSIYAFRNHDSVIPNWVSRVHVRKFVDCLFADAGTVSSLRKIQALFAEREAVE